VLHAAIRAAAIATGRFLALAILQTMPPERGAH
jgi:hypothetical protein